MSLPLGIVDLIMKFATETFLFITYDESGEEQKRIFEWIDSEYNPGDFFLKEHIIKVPEIRKLLIKFKLK